MFNHSDFGIEVVDQLKLFFFVNGYSNKITYSYGPFPGQKSRIIITASSPEEGDSRRDSIVYQNRIVKTVKNESEIPQLPEPWHPQGTTFDLKLRL